MEAPWLAALCFQIAFQLVTCAPAMQSEIDKRATTIPMQIDFSGLKRTCLQRGWYDCYNGLQQISDQTDTSNPNSTLSKCLVSARWYLNTSAAVNSTTAADNCPLLDAAKKTAGRQMYCDIFSKISITWQLYIIGQLTQLYTVASYDASVIAPTPGQLRDSLLQWQTDMSNLHLSSVTPCCNNSGITLRRRSIANWCAGAPSVQARKQCLWEKALVDAGTTMRTSELLESLGRLQKCLRGCVSLEEVNCSNILPTTRQ